MKNINISMVKRIAFMSLFALAVIVGASVTSFAQNHSQRQEKQALKQHQRQERYYGGYGTKDHQKQERRALKYDQRYERQVYNNNGYYNNQRGNGGYYGNRGFGSGIRLIFGGRRH